MQRVAVGVVDLAFRERPADRRELVAGGEEGDAQLSLDLDFRNSEGRDQAELGGAQQPARREHRHADLQVLARVAHVLPGFLAFRDKHPVVLFVALNDFLNDHGIGARRHDCAGHDSHALHFSNVAEKRLASERGADFAQRGIVFQQIREAKGVSVHRRVVVRGNIDGGHDVLREHAAQSLPDLDFLEISDG